MSTKQRNWIQFVAEHNTGFATPAPNDGIYIYSPAVDRAGRWDILRELATTFREVRAILGY